jgi:replicative DNA helicase
MADIVVLLNREDYYDLGRAPREGKESICEVIVTKNRNGPRGTVDLYFDKVIPRFANLAGRVTQL